MARSTRRDDRSGREGEGGRAVLFVVLVLAVLAGGVYAAAYLASADKVPRGTTVAGVAIGGHSPTTAEQILRVALAPRADAPFRVTVEGRTRTIRPSAVGLGVDYTASVDQATAERSWRPSRMWRYYTDGGPVDPVRTLDQARLAGLIRHLDATEGSEAVDGSVVFHRDSFVVRPPHPGVAVDPQAAGQTFWNAYLSGSTSVLLPLFSTQPAIGAVRVHRFVRTVRQPGRRRGRAAALRSQRGAARTSEYARFLGSRVAGHHLVATVRSGRVSDVVHRHLGRAGTRTPRNATVAIVGGRPQVVSSRPGVDYAAPGIGKALLRAITSPSRSARVAPTLVPASFTDRDAGRLRIRQLISTDTVPLARGGDLGRLQAAVHRLDGTVLRPGATASLRQIVRALPTGARGDALAPAVFGAAWRGGLAVGGHVNAASYDGTRRSATTSHCDGGHDVSFTDDTRNGVLLSLVLGAPTRAHGGTLTVSLWSTPTWHVTTTTGARTHVVRARTVVDHGQGCVARPGRDGFDATVTRTFTRPGGSQADHSQSYTAHYVPVDAVVCKQRDPPAPPRAPVTDGSGDPGHLVQLLEQTVGGALDLFVPPLRRPVHARDQPRAVDAAEVAVDEGVARLGLVGGAVGERQVPGAVRRPVVALEEGVLGPRVGLDVAPVAVEDVLLGRDQLTAASDGGVVDVVAGHAAIGVVRRRRASPRRTSGREPVQVARETA